MKPVRFTVILAAVIFTTFDAWAQSPENVLVVINAASPASVEIGNYYAEKRKVPAQQVIRLQMPVTESIERADFERQIEAPIALWLTRSFAQDRILYIVLTKGVPLRVNGTTGQDGTVASVDSELSLLYRKLSGLSVPPGGRTNNPYFLGNTPVAERPAFTHEKYDIYLVSRLDAYTVADVRALIDRGSSPARDGAVVLDDRGSTENTWMRSAADALRSSQRALVHDTTATVVRDVKNVFGYYSWGSNDPAIRDRQFNLAFVPGALAAMFVSTDARTMNEPPSDWKIGIPEDPTTHFAGSPQSLTGDLIRAGVTGAAGHVAEPYLDATIRPNILFPAYLAGANLIESFYSAMPFLSWQTVVIGDPLCAPFEKQGLAQDQISKGMDPATELPAFFSARRLATMAAMPVTAGIDQDTLKLVLLADARSAKQDRAGVLKALEEATARDGRLAPAHLNLAMLYEQSAEYDKAIERYRRVLETNPNNIVVLNNLAFALAVRKGALQEALPLAERAYGGSNRNPNVADTLAWILHLSGDNRRAHGFLAEAVKAAPQNATIRFHLATVLAALGDTPSARVELAEALQLDPKLTSRPEVAQLRDLLK